MKHNVLVVLVLALFTLGLAGQGFCAQVVGIVKDGAGRPVQGVKVKAIDASGKIAGEAVSGPTGAYVLNGLKTGRYVFKLDPMASGVQAGDSVAYLGPEGLAINWTVSSTATALDDATIGAGATGIVPGGTIAGISITTGVLAGVTAAAVVGGTLGGLAASGAIGGGGGSKSPSL